MDKDLFSDIQSLGFDNVEEIDLFNKIKKEDIKIEKEIVSDVETEKSLLYDREVICPVCSNKFKVKTIKKGGYRPQSRDSDSFVHYDFVNPYFYDVWVCGDCGYSAMESDFLKIKSYQIPLVVEKVSPKWQGKTYPETYDVNTAIERYKIALLNYFYIDALASKKAMTCLRLAWMYRIIKDDAKEIAFIKQAIEGFEVAYFNEDFPIYKIDKFSMLYLLGELNRRIGNNDKALSWFSQVITALNAPQKLKDKTRDQKELIDEAQKNIKKEAPIEETSNAKNIPIKKEGFFSKFLKK
jgi:uncharacterized protein (DUF2225 family)